MTESVDFDGPSILPHGENARFISEVVASGNGQLVCTGRVPPESPFVRKGTVPGFVLLELAAQAAAIEVLAAMKTRGLRPNMGYLVRAQGLHWTAENVAAGLSLTASVRREDSIPPLYTYRATVAAEGVELFGGKFSIYVEA